MTFSAPSDSKTWHKCYCVWVGRYHYCSVSRYVTNVQKYDQCLDAKTFVGFLFEWQLHKVVELWMTLGRGEGVTDLSMASDLNWYVPSFIIVWGSRGMSPIAGWVNWCLSAAFLITWSRLPFQQPNKNTPIADMQSVCRSKKTCHVHFGTNCCLVPRAGRWLWQGTDTTGISPLICGYHRKNRGFSLLPPIFELSPVVGCDRVYVRNISAKFEGERRIIAWKREILVTVFFA